MKPKLSLGAAILGLAMLFTNYSQAEVHQPPLYTNFWMHFEEDTEYLEETSFIEKAEIIYRLGEICNRYGAKLCYQVDWTLVEGVMRYDPGLFSYLESLGHEVSTHTHETVFSMAEVKNKLDPLIKTNLNGDGHFTVGSWNHYMSDLGFTHTSTFKNLFTQTDNNQGFVWRPLIASDYVFDLDDWYDHNYRFPAHEPKGAIVYIGTNSISIEIEEPNLGSFTRSLELAFTQVDPLRVNTACVNLPIRGWPEDFTERERWFTNLETWLSEGGERLKREGKIDWKTMHEIYELFVTWETNNPDLSPLPQNNTFKGDIRTYTVPSGWTFYTQHRDYRACTPGYDVLVNNMVTSLLIDQDGTKWIGTMNGISRFDGVTWTNITTENGLPVGYIHCLASDPNGGIWAGTNGGGVCRINSDGSVGVVYDTYNSPLLTNYIHAIKAGPQGGLLLGAVSMDDSPGGLSFRTVDGLWSSFNSTNSVLSDDDIIAISLHETLAYLGTSGGGVAKLDLVSKEITLLPTINPLSTRTSYVHSLISMPDTLWAGTYGNGIASYDKDSWTVYSADSENDYDFDNIIQPDGIIIDKYGTKWVATLGGLYSFREGSWIKHQIPLNGFFSNRPTSIAINFETNNLWIGTYRGIKIINLNNL